MKVVSCQKLRKILDDFLAVTNFRGRALQKLLYARYHPYLGSRRLEKFPTSPDVIEAHTLNFKHNFKFSRLKFFGGPSSQLVCTLGSLGQSLANLKISGRSTP